MKFSSKSSSPPPPPHPPLPRLPRLSARIVAIETSSRQGSVAVAEGAQLLEVRQLPAGNRHATELMPAIKALTDSQGWRPEQIEHIYLSLGPGSFTGLRIAIAIARAMAQAIGCKIVGVPSLDVIAHNAPVEFQFVVPLLDAKRGQVFAARYQRDPSGELARIVEPTLVDPAAFIGETLSLAQGGSIALLGEGLEYHRTAIASITASNLSELDRPLWPPRAETVHRLGWIAASNGYFSDPQTLLPTYIRLPEAEEVWRKKHGLSS